MKSVVCKIVYGSMIFFVMGCSHKNKQSDNIVNVKTMTVSRLGISENSSYPGTIEEVDGTSLSFSTAGTIKALYIHEGQQVSAGQIIGVVDASTSANAVTMAKATTNQARESVRQAEDAYRRMKMLHDNGSLPEIKWVEVETKVSQAKQMLTQAQAAEQIARKGLSDTRLKAPFSGYIVGKNAEVGQNVIPGQPIAKLVRIDQVKVKISVPEEDLSHINVGQTITFNVSSLGKENYTGKITEKNVSADPISRAYTVKALVNNANRKLLPGMVCDAYIHDTSTQATGITLPANIIQIDVDNKPFVWVVEKGKAVKRMITLGNDAGENIVIESGLNEGEKVIIEGQQKVSNGQKVHTL